LRASPIKSISSRRLNDIVKGRPDIRRNQVNTPAIAAELRMIKTMVD